MIVDVPRMTGVKKKACLPMNSRNPVHDGGMTIPHTIWCRKMLRILPNYGQTPFHGNGCFPQSFRYIQVPKPALITRGYSDFLC